MSLEPAGSTISANVEYLKFSNLKFSSHQDKINDRKYKKNVNEMKWRPYFEKTKKDLPVLISTG